jgi:hypothetical protein
MAIAEPNRSHSPHCLCKAASFPNSTVVGAIPASRIAPHEPEALHPRRYRGPAGGGRFAAVAHARLAARRYYATRWLAEVCPPSMQHLQSLP